MQIRTNEVSFNSSDGKITVLKYLLATFVGFGLAFQAGHFAEHGIQFAVWLLGESQWVITTFCGRDTAFMSAPVTTMVGFLGAYLFPDANVARQMMVGMEMLHLIGNSIFLSTIVGLFYFVSTNWVRYAFYIEGAHLIEHISLTLTAYYLGKPVGLSTVFGQASLLFDRELAVGWRVSWHFFMNLLPMPFIMVALMQHWKIKDWREKPRENSQMASMGAPENGAVSTITEVL